MRIRRPRLSQEQIKVNQESNRSLKDAFRHEVQPQIYLFRVWISSIIASAVFAYFAASTHGSFELEQLVPLSGVWRSHDPFGGLYLETWAGILVNGLQAGFALWGSILLVLGVYRLCNAYKYVFACFSLGTAFFGFVLFLPAWTQTLLNMLIDKCPVLTH